MSNERIDLTDGALRKQIHEHTGIYHEPTVEDVETILHGIKGIGLIAELKRCYEENDKMKYSIVKNRGDCWVCDMPIDSCDARSCERQMLEDIELGTASE